MATDAAGAVRPKGWVRRFLKAVDRLGQAFVDAVVGVNRSLQRSIRFRLAAVLVMVLTAVALTWLLRPKVEYLPTGNRNLVFGMLMPPPGYNINKMLELSQEIGDYAEV